MVERDYLGVGGEGAGAGGAVLGGLEGEDDGCWALDRVAKKEGEEIGSGNEIW